MRDTGILHQLLGIASQFDLEGHPMLGASWETYVIEQLAALMPDWAELYFYRTHQGTEADIVITKGGTPEILVEVKYSSTPKLTKGFYLAQNDLQTKKHFVVCPIAEGYPISENTRVIGLSELSQIFESS
jgi:uncharacterized protein